MPRRSAHKRTMSDEDVQYRGIRVTVEDVAKSASVLSRRDVLDEMALPSYSHGNPLIRWLFWSRLTCAIDLLQPHKGESFLDFGTGTGVLLPALSATAETVYACDLFPEPARRMKQLRGLDNVTVLSSPEITPEDIAVASLDGIAALDVLEHVDDLARVVQMLGELLRPDGRIVVSGPTESFVYRIGRNLAGFRGKGEYHRRDIFEITREFVKRGFRLRRSKRLFPFPAPKLFLIHRFELS